MKDSKISISILCTWPFYASLIALALNDHFFKYQYSNFITGKLSDFAGIFLVVLILNTIWPNHRMKTTISVVGLFLFWKSPFSQPLLDLINVISPFTYARVVDYTDLIAFSVIPLAHYVFDNRNKFVFKQNVTEYLKVSAAVFAMLAITATSVYHPYETYQIRKVEAQEAINVAKAIEVINQSVKRYGLLCESCDPNAEDGLFKSEEVILYYKILPNLRGMEFEITAYSGAVFVNFGETPQEKMNKIKRALQRSLGKEFENMEFSVNLPNDDILGSSSLWGKYKGMKHREEVE